MAVFIVLWPYLLTTKLRSVIGHNLGHSNIEDMLSLMTFTPSYAIFYAIYPKLCYLLCHIPRSSAIFFLNVMLQYITLTPSYANSSYAMFSGQSWGRISGYCCMHKFKKKCLTYCNLSKISWHFILEVTSHVTELRRNWVRCPPYCKNW